MNPAWGQVAGVVTLALMLVFIGIWAWAWRPRHRSTFDTMARLPMSDTEVDAGAAIGKYEDSTR